MIVRPSLRASRWATATAKWLSCLTNHRLMPRACASVGHSSALRKRCNVAADAGRLMPLAEAISDGRPIDWAAADVGSTTAEDRDLVRHLRLLAGMADV